MGSFLSNLHVRDAGASAIANALRAWAAPPTYVAAAPTNGWTGVYPDEIGQDSDRLAQLALRLSAQVVSPVIAFLVHDSDILFYWLYDRGELVDYFNSAPGYWGDIVPPEGGEVAILLRYCTTATSTSALKRILIDRWQYSDEPDAYVFADDTLGDLADCLGIGSAAALRVYPDIQETDGRFLHVTADSAPP